MVPTPRLIAAMEAFIEARCRQAVRAESAAATRAPFDLAPDLSRRVCALGLGAHVDQLRDLGFTIVAEAGREHASALREAVLASGGVADGLLGSHAVWPRVLTDPVVLTLAETVVGAGALLGSLEGDVRRAGDVGEALHCGQDWWPAPFPEHSQLVSFCWVTDDGLSSVLGGPIGVVPGSHRRRRHPARHEIEDVPSVAPLLAPRGALLAWRGEAWVSRYGRLLSGEAVTAMASYTRLCCRPRDDFSVYANEAWLAGKPAALRTLLGLDDMLGKARSQGAALCARTLQAARR